MTGLALRDEVKEEAGKVFSVEVLLTPDCRVSRLSVFGDFFAFPPELFDVLESKASGERVTELPRIFSEVLERVELVGVRRESVIKLIERIVSRGLEVCREGSA